MNIIYLNFTTLKKRYKIELIMLLETRYIEHSFSRFNIHIFISTIIVYDMKNINEFSGLLKYQFVLLKKLIMNN